MQLTAWLALAVFTTAYVVIVSEKFNRTLVALLGAAGMVAIGAVRGHEIFFSEETGIDWNVIFLLFGMMSSSASSGRPASSSSSRSGRLSAHRHARSA